LCQTLHTTHMVAQWWWPSRRERIYYYMNICSPRGVMKKNRQKHTGPIDIFIFYGHVNFYRWQLNLLLSPQQRIVYKVGFACSILIIIHTWQCIDVHWLVFMFFTFFFVHAIHCHNSNNNGQNITMNGNIDSFEATSCGFKY